MQGYLLRDANRDPLQKRTVSSRTALAGTQLKSGTTSAEKLKGYESSNRFHSSRNNPTTRQILLFEERIQTTEQCYHDTENKDQNCETTYVDFLFRHRSPKCGACLTRSGITEKHKMCQLHSTK